MACTTAPIALLSLRDGGRGAPDQDAWTCTGAISSSPESRN
jgi:hypothetical protein